MQTIIGLIKLGDDLNFSKMEDDIIFSKMEDYLNFSKMEYNFNCSKMEDDLNFSNTEDYLIFYLHSFPAQIYLRVGSAVLILFVFFSTRKTFIQK